MKTRTLALVLPLLGVVACHDDVTEASSVGSSDGSSSAAATTVTTSADTSGATDSMGSVSNSAGSTDTGTTGATTDLTATGSSTGGSSSSSDGESSSGTTDTGGGMPCAEDVDCDDLLPCNGVETCDGSFCVAGTPTVCNDDVPCTVDSCSDLDGGVCTFSPDDAACDDGLFCTGAESCDVSLDCQPGQAIVCDDGVACTMDSCDEDSDACAFAADHASCQDGTFCNGEEVCDGAQDCIDGPAVDCNDLVACTNDTCNEGTDQCDHAADDQQCDNGVFCDGVESCDAIAGCGDGQAVACASDGVPCTVDQCNENDDACESVPNNNACNGGQFCTLNGCIAGAQCTIQNGVLGNPACDDGLGCNGAELCFDLPGNIDQCQPGAPLVCGDAFACTFDSCVEPGNCQHVANDGVCADADPCNGTEVCNVAQGCIDGPNLDCTDGVMCTFDNCVPNFGCNNIAEDADCDDGIFCNGAETCDLVQDCQLAQPVACPSDGIACTTESCDEVADACVSTPSNDVCPCGQVCNPQAGGCDDTCSPATCQGHVYQCGNCLDDDADCDIDGNDSNCFGPCSNNEDGLDGDIPGQDNAPCKHDCYFDNNSGTGNDDCFWNHECDPLEPSATTCEYDANANTPGTPLSCVQLEVMQSPTCDAVCGPLTPNGCDCFGCCTVDLPGIGPTEIFLGSKVDGDGMPTCSVEVFDDANVLDLCHPCSQVPACLNACDPCELCFGGPVDLPPECGGVQDCGVGGIVCGLPGQDPCPNGQACITGCCEQG